MALKKSDLRNILKNEDASNEEKISEILNILHDEVDSVKDERDELKTKLGEAEKQLKDSENTDSEWKEKYEKEHSDFESYKNDQVEKETKATKEAEYTRLLKETGVSENLIGLILKGADLSKIEIEDGKVKNAEALTESIKEEYKNYIVTSETKGTQTHVPPENNGGKPDLDKLSMEEYIKARKS